MSGDNKSAIKYIEKAIDTDPPHAPYYRQQLEKFKDKKRPKPD